MNEQGKIKAVGLFSGGLDSILAVRIMMEQGIDVTSLHIRTGLTYERRERLAGREPAGPSKAERSAEMLGVELEIVEAFDEYIPTILHPRHGYGSEMNPCMDCRIFLLRQAKDWMEEHSHRFVFTGEVVGQRPNSQMPAALKTIEQESGLEGYLLRPLSAKLLEPTIPEKRGWVDREKLYDVSGRSRKPQMRLAKQFGITDYPQPAGGGCFLVDQAYARRLRDFLAHEGEDALTSDRALLLAIGRHFRLPSGHKLIVGRHEGENDYLEKQREEGVLLRTVDHLGPITLVQSLSKEPREGEIEQAARITARYSDGKREPSVRVEVHSRDGLSVMLDVEPMAPGEVQALMV